MDMLDFILLIQVFLLGWVGHSFYISYKMRRLFEQIAKQNGVDLGELKQALDKEMTISKVNITKVPNYFTEAVENSIMLYNKDTGKFMGQANTVEALAEDLYRFNKIQYALVNHDSKQFWFVKGKVQTQPKDLE